MDQNNVNENFRTSRESSFDFGFEAEFQNYYEK